MLTAGSLDDLKALEEERKALQPEKESPAPDAEATEKETEKETEDEEMKDAEEVDDTNMDSEDEDVLPQRSLRRATDRAAERKRKLDEERKRKERAEIEKAKKPTKEARQLEKLLRKTDNVRDKIKECEAQMADIDQDLRENDIPRTRVLGKDRFWNRYYWFERNAMPYAGIPTSSTADAGYANGSIWVQGPDDIERVGFIDLSDAENARYEAAFGVTVPARKIMEEGATHTFTAHQWGYYDDPNDLDKLIGWLNDKGVREIKLRKELSAHREQIAIRMIKRNECLTSPRDKSAEASEQVTRISTRTKTYSGPSGHRFMAWKNTWALRELGHLHSEPTKPHSRRGVARVISNPKKAPVEEEVRQTRGTANKHGKPLGRQGTRYNF